MRANENPHKNECDIVQLSSNKNKWKMTANGRSNDIKCDMILRFCHGAADPRIFITSSLWLHVCQQLVFTAQSIFLSKYSSMLTTALP